MLFLWPGTSTLLRGQGTYVTDDEINRVVDIVRHDRAAVRQGAGPAQSRPIERRATKRPSRANRDELYDAAVDVVVREGAEACSLLQRALGIGYGRAARLIDFMAEDGIVGQYNGSQAREVLLTLEQWGEMSGQRGKAPSAAPPAAAAPPRRSGRVLTVAPRLPAPHRRR